MKLMERLRGVFEAKNARTPDDVLFKTIAGGRTDSGINVNHDNALTLSWVWQATSIISNDIGRLPTLLYDKTDEDNRKRATLHPAYKLMKTRPNPWMTAKTFKGLLTFQALMHGNGLAVIIRDGRGAPMEMYPLDPSRTKLEFVDGEPFYVTRIGDDQEQTAIPHRDVLHIKGQTQTGFWGIDVLSYARNSVGLALAEEKHGASTFKNNARPSVVLQTEGTMDKQKADQLLESWNAMHQGVSNAHKVAILSGGMQVKPISVSNDNAQWLESRKFQRQEVASWFLLPPSKLGDDGSVSFSSVEAFNRQYVDMTLMNWVVNWEQELTDKLCTPRQKMADSHEFEFLTAGLLRGDLVSRFQAYQIGIQSEFMNPNEVRRLENMPRRVDEKGDEYQNPATKSAEQQADDKQAPAAKVQVPHTAPMRQALHNLVTDRMERMVQIEINKTMAAAKHPDRFMAWIESFSEDFQKTMVDALQPCVTTAQAAGFAVADVPSIVADYMQDSVQRLLDVAGAATPDQLKEKTATEVSEWQQRVATTVQKIFMEQKEN